MSTDLAFGATVALGAAGVCCDPLGGALSDRFGRKPVMVGTWALLLVLVWPSFWLIAYFRTVTVLWVVAALLGMLSAAGSSAVLAAITESIPKRVRSGTLAIIYAIAIAVFGGSAQFNVAWLTRVTHTPMAPAWYMTIGVAIGLAAMVGLRETAPARSKHARPTAP